MNSVTLSATFRLAQSQFDGASLMVMKKALDTFKQDGDTMTKMLTSIPMQAEPNLGNNIDIKA